MKVLIVGGVAGGATAAARLRRLDEQAEIVLLERGAYISYANCGLPYYIGGEITDQAALSLQTPESFFSRFRIDVRTGQEAISVDPQAKTVTVRKLSDGTTYTEGYDKLLLSPGAEPVRPPWSAIDDPRLFTLRTIPDTLRITDRIRTQGAKRAVIVGGGFIGIEMAENFARAGLAVTVVEMADHIIAPLDSDMACFVQNYLRGQDVRVLLNTGVQDIRAGEGGLDVVLPTQTLSADIVLLCIGVRPESTLATNAGLACSPKGAILVDAQMQTSHPDIYAVGDAVQCTNLVSGAPGYTPLAGPANKQGRVAADHICGLSSAYRGTQGSAVAKLFDMTIAVTGMNESALTAAGIAYDKVYTASPSHATYYPGASELSLKLLFHPENGRVLGAQVIGFEGVDKRCDVLATAIRAGMTVEDLTELELCYAPPFSSAKDPVNMAGFVAQNLRSGLVQQAFWQGLPTLLGRDDVILLDVRTPEEFNTGHIDGFRHIPLDTLRARLDELPAGLPIYLHCHSGLRSYLACRILTQNGRVCYNLAGGYRLYETMAQNDKDA